MPVVGLTDQVEHIGQFLQPLELGLDISVVDGGTGGSAVGSGGETPLQLFARVGTNDGRIVHALVDGGADPNGKNREGETPLHTAIRNGGNAENPNVVEALLAAGADPCIKDVAGYIPYSTAREGGAVHGMLANAGGYGRACDGAPEIVEADRTMQASERANLRRGPGTDYGKAGLLEAGDEVAVTGGGTLPVIGKLLGHANIETTARYAHLANESVKVSGSRIGDSIGKHIANNGSIPE